MLSVQPCPLPQSSLLRKYEPTTSRDPSYTDCYRASVQGQITLNDYVYAFYTTLPFKTERLILTHAVKKPSDDGQARELADCEVDSFAAWTVEARTHDQLLMRDYTGATRSWLMVEPKSDKTILYFGSAVVPRNVGRDGTAKRSVIMRALTPFHLVYSRVLLATAKARLEKTFS